MTPVQYITHSAPPFFQFLDVSGPAFMGCFLPLPRSPKKLFQGGRNEDVPGGLPMGLHGDGHQLQGYGRDTLHPDGKVGQSLQPKNIIIIQLSTGT